MSGEPITARLFQPDPRLEREGARLSPGCRACRQGRWLCVFMTMRCNLRCPECPAPERQSRKPRSVAGGTLEQVLDGIGAFGFHGVALSGGEALLAGERAARWCAAVRRRHPRVYLWLYTNGLLASPRAVAELADCGLDEVRFNLSATDYQSEEVWHNLEAACGLLPAVAVEVPVIPARRRSLIEATPRLAAAGVRYLNLHELIPTGGDDQAGSQERYALDDRQQVGRLPGAREALEEVAREVERRFPDLCVNRCSHEVKRHQMAMRRLTALRRWPAEPTQRVTGAGYLQSVLARFPGGRLELVHPAAADSLELEAEELTLLTYRPRLSLDESRCVVAQQPHGGRHDSRSGGPNSEDDAG